MTHLPRDLDAGRHLGKLERDRLVFQQPLAERLPLARKASSELGRTDYLRVRIEEGRVVPLTASGAGILSSAVRADGFVVIPSASEGYPADALVDVFRYDETTNWAIGNRD